MIQNKRILLAAGGTGGHVFPAIALGQFLQEKGFEVEFATDARGAKYFANYSLSYKILHSASPNGLKSIAKLAFGFIQTLLLVRRFGCVIGFGGYPSFAPILAAKIWRKKTILHEQNAVLGKVNRVLQKFADHVATSFERTKFADHATYVGSFVRGGFALKPMPAYDGKLNLLIIGGSQGAKIFTQIFPRALAGLDVNITHQVPEAELEAAKSAYAAAGLEADLRPFFTDIKQRIEAAHLVVSRAGSSSIFELVAIGRPAIFVPLPSAADNHQFENARELAEQNASWLVPENDEATAKITEILQQFSAENLQERATKMHSFAIANSNDKMLELIEN